MGVIREALSGKIKGNLGLDGAYSKDYVDHLGRNFVGPNASLIDGGKGLLSADGLRVYRFPIPKAYSNGDLIGNLEARTTPNGPYTVNIHVTVFVP